MLLLQVAKEHGRQLESAQEELAIIRAEKAELAVRTDRTTLLPKPCLAFLIRYGAVQAQLTGTRKLQMSYERLLTAFSAKCTALKDAQDVRPSPLSCVQ